MSRFFVTALTVFGTVHFYLWARLIHAPELGAHWATALTPIAMGMSQNAQTSGRALQSEWKAVQLHLTERLVDMVPELREIVIAIRIEQAQSGEMTFQPELFRRRRDQNQAGRSARERFDRRVGGTRRLLVPAQMVRFIDDHQIPGRRECLLTAPRVVNE